MNRTVKKRDTIQPTFRPSVADNWCQTLSESTKSDCEWNIQFPFFEYPPNGMSSPRFSLGNYWFWSLGLTGSSGIININLNLERSDKEMVEPIRVTTRILNKKGDLFFPEASGIFQNDAISITHRPGRYAVTQNFVYKHCVSEFKKEEFEKSKFYEKYGNFTIYCAVEIWTSKDTKSGSGSSKMTSDIRHNQLFLAQFEEIFKNNTLSDVKLNVSGRLFSAHKIILAARSKVFAAMFEHKTVEKLSNKVDIKDVDPDVFQEVLRYMYTGAVTPETMEKVAVGILAVADKYLLDQLKDECEIHLKNGMSADNCAELLALSAQPHPAIHLKKYAVDFLRRYPDLVVATDGWKKAKEEKLVWSCDLIEMLCDRKCSGV